MSSTLTNLIYHVVFSTKNRAPLIQDNFQSELHSYIGAIVKTQGGAVLEIGGISDHIHLLIKLRANISIANMVRLIKANSSKWANEKSMKLSFAWQRGYGAFTMSSSQIEGLRRYVREQAEHHRNMTFQGEFLELLNKNETPYEIRFLWD